LNGRNLTGEMVLELAVACTGAINEDKLPNIGNAWTYVCQNECQRALDDSIDFYKAKMIPICEQAKSSLDDSTLKSKSRELKEQAVMMFK
jgi:hypothetical protein